MIIKNYKEIQNQGILKGSFQLSVDLGNKKLLSINMLHKQKDDKEWVEPSSYKKGEEWYKVAFVTKELCEELLMQVALVVNKNKQVEEITHEIKF